MILHTASIDQDTLRTLRTCHFMSNEAPFDMLNPLHAVHYNITFNEAQEFNRDSTIIKTN
jgi:hypothetical protein